MFRLAFRQLCDEPPRSGLTVLVVSAVIAAILVVRSFEQGLYAQSRAMVLDRGADLVVAQAGVANFVAVRSSLRQLSRVEVEAIPGVAEAHPITSLPVIYERAGHKTPIYMIVYDTLGAPPHLVVGHLPAESPEIVVDRALARKFGLEIADSLVLFDFTFRVSGIADNSSAFFMPFAFTSYDAMLDFMLESEIAPDLSTFPLLSYLLVELEPGAEPRKTAAAIEEGVTDVSVYLPREMAINDEEMTRNLIGSIMGLLIGTTYAVGFLVVGLIIYAEVRGRQRDFAVLKALGFQRRQLASTVAFQTALILLAGLPASAALAWGTAEVVERLAPLYRLPVLEASGLLRTFGGSAVMALFGGLIPLRMINRIDPLIAFARD